MYWVKVGLTINLRGNHMAISCSVLRCDSLIVLRGPYLGCRRLNQDQALCKPIVCNLCTVILGIVKVDT